VRSELRDLASIEVKELTVRMMSRIPFAVWNTAAATPIAPDAIPNASAAILGGKKRVVHVERVEIAVAGASSLLAARRRGAGDIIDHDIAPGTAGGTPRQLS